MSAIFRFFIVFFVWLGLQVAEAGCLPYQSDLPDQLTMLAPQSSATSGPKTYILPATGATTQWGFFDNNQPPVLRIKSGDTVIIETMAASDNQVVPGTTLAQIEEMKDAVPKRGPHTLTGPIYVEDAKPGDIIRIHINKIIPRSYASNDSVPGKGLFPEEFPQGFVKYFYLDLKKNQMQFAPGIVLPVRPFPGIIAVARKEAGKFNSSPPGPFGGNLDLREMVAGTTLYLPVFQEGALVWTGDSHAGQGNGEIDLTAIETAFQELNLTIDVIKQKNLAWPRIETPNNWIAVGYDADLNKAVDILKNETVKLIIDERKVSEAEAQKIMFATWNCPIAEVVNGVQGVYCMIPKKGVAQKPPVLPILDNAKYYVTYSKNKDIEQAMKTASMEMINKIAEAKKMTRVDVYALLSLAMDCRLAPYHSAEKEVHCMLPKNIWV